jgi:hypothetical protein
VHNPPNRSVIGGYVAAILFGFFGVCCALVHQAQQIFGMGSNAFERRIKACIVEAFDNLNDIHRPMFEEWYFLPGAVRPWLASPAAHDFLARCCALTHGLDLAPSRYCAVAARSGACQRHRVFASGVLFTTSLAPNLYLLHVFFSCLLGCISTFNNTSVSIPVQTVKDYASYIS